MKAKIESDLKEAMKARNQGRLLVIRSLLSELKKVEIDSRASLTDEQCIDLVKREIKKRRDALEYAVQGRREDLIALNEGEIAILQEYLGAQMTEDELRAAISVAIGSGADTVGKVMGLLNREHRGKFEGRTANSIAQELLKKSS